MIKLKTSLKMCESPSSTKKSKKMLEKCKMSYLLVQKLISRNNKFKSSKVP